ncbi:hypothetical protein CRE_26848, partial [Caenorhabditis remanei]
MTTENVKAELACLPSEILCHLFTFLPTRQLTTEIPLICQRFHTILKDDKFWNGRIRTEYKVRLPDCETKHSEYEPKKSFVAISTQKERWRDEWAESQTIHTALGHSATVDSVLLFESQHRQFCLSGARDRSIRLWDLERVRSGDGDTVDAPWTVAKDETAHLGWIWNMARDSESGEVYTTSWDSTVKNWAIREGGAIQNLNSVNVGSAAQCVSVGGAAHEIVCTTFAKRTA